jgi:hypothetical protein
MPVQLDPDRALPPVVFERTIVRNEVRVVSPSQPAADLLTGPGWELAEGNEHLALRSKGGSRVCWRIATGRPLVRSIRTIDIS